MSDFDKYRELMPIEKIIEWLSDMECKDGAMFEIEYYTRNGVQHIVNIRDMTEDRIGFINFLTQHEIAVKRIERIC